MSGLTSAESFSSVLMQPRRRLNAGRRRHTDVQRESVQHVPEGGGIDATRTQPIHGRNHRGEHGGPLGRASWPETFFILRAYR